MDYNYDKQDCSDGNLITLCNSCNARANGSLMKRRLWTEFYTFIIEEVVRNAA